MGVRRTAQCALLIAGSALFGLLTAGCTGGSSTSGNASGNASGTSASTPAQPSTNAMDAGMNAPSGGLAGAGTGGPSGAGSGSGGTGAAGSHVLPECKAASLRLGFGQGDAAAGSSYTPLQFTNISHSSCVLAGFPGVSYVAGSDGHQVGLPAQRSGQLGGQFTLQPGRMAAAIVQQANTGNFDPAQCHAVPVRGLRVYAPDDTAAMYIPFPDNSTTACSVNPMGPQIFVQTVKPGTGRP